MSAHFTPPTLNQAPPVLPDGDPDNGEGGVRLFRFFRARPTGQTVYQYRAGSPMAVRLGEISETDPFALYDHTGTATTDGWQDVVTVFWGGCNPVEITDAQAVLLVAAGYHVDP